MAKRATDPGWGPALRALPVMLIPVLGMKRVQRHGSGLFVMRIIWIAFCNALTFIWVPVVLIRANGGIDAAFSTTPVLVVTATIGVFAQLVGFRYSPSYDFSAPALFATSFQRAFFIRLAFAEVAGLVGFVGFVLSGSVLPYAVGYVLSLAGMIDAAPKASRFAAAQYEADSAGARIDVVGVLDGQRLSR